MNIKINALNAMQAGDSIIVNMSIPSSYKNAVQSFIDGFNAVYDYELKRVKQKRSLSANGYAWVLMDRIAAALKITKEEVYRKAINYGSSTYDTAEMARLIDYIVDEAKRLHIETLPPEKLEIIKTEWGKK